TRSCDGGLDANWLIARGLPTVTLGCGQAGIHTVEETLHIPSYLEACRVATRLASGDG
ncbi:MAG: peptidase M20, partial [Planctomycetaceae bacterium]